ncbi:hypothetical protein HHK36_002624 [Tetracentron sinense]|uniref:B30.2/SPRY domain-containing protein n=1 Tax=Tetracentron sinense TaxID=13715 RepID=A0A835DRS1_TETSI|nr:hypothetical protein HHK36_002624 [Tetracentron sinense]
MQGWIIVTVAAVLPVLVLVVLGIVLLRRCCSSKGCRDFRDRTRRRRTSESLQAGIAKLNLIYDTNSRKNLASFHHQFDLDNKRRPNYYVLRRGVLAKPLFSWADHPSLVSEAVEHGWSRFAFTGYIMSSSPSTRSKLLGLCAVGDQGRDNEAEISWEVFPGSPDFMQRIRLNSGLKKIYTGSPLGASCVIETALPLPGPPLGNSPFPQEAYFEITILSSGEHDVGSMAEGERIKLIRDTAEVKANLDSSLHVIISNGNTKLEESRLGSKEEWKGQPIMLSLGLTGGGSLPPKVPGSYPGSIGFNSNGSVYLDGMKLVFEDEKAEWGSKDKVIGCGFDPGRKKVFFTLDSELVHVIHCTSEEFGSPIYPTLAANMDAMVLVNFGQSAFKYAPANMQRTPNPCFVGPLVNAPAGALGYEDSRELFSMGRIDSQWLNRCMTKNSTAVDTDESEADTADLFEIVLDNGGRTPSPVL